MTPSAQLPGRMFGSRQIRYKPCRLEAGYNGPGLAELKRGSASRVPSEERRCNMAGAIPILILLGLGFVVCQLSAVR